MRSRTRDRRIASPTRWPLGHAACCYLLYPFSPGINRWVNLLAHSSHGQVKNIFQFLPFRTVTTKMRTKVKNWRIMQKNLEQHRQILQGQSLVIPLLILMLMANSWQNILYPGSTKSWTLLILQRMKRLENGVRSIFGQMLEVLFSWCRMDKYMTNVKER